MFHRYLISCDILYWREALCLIVVYIYTIVECSNNNIIVVVLEKAGDIIACEVRVGVV